MKPINFIGIDIGTKNFSCAVVRKDEKAVTVSSLTKKDIGNGVEEWSTNMLGVLNDYIDDGSFVAIEQQLGPNAKMSNVAHLLYGLIRGRVREVNFVSSISKFNLFVKLNWIKKDEIGRGKKLARKKLAVKLCDEILNSVPCNNGVRDFFDACKKKDDLGDSLIYAISLADSYENFLENKNSKFIRIQI